MAKRKRYRPKAFESSGISSDTSSNIYDSMLRSPAMLDLTSRQFRLYACMKAQMYAQKKKPPGENTFFFNKARWLKGNDHSYGLYSNGKDFATDVNALVSHGFIRVLENNANLRKMNVYQFAEGWKTWEPPPK